MATVLVDPEELSATEVVVKGSAYRHLFRALRAAVGDSVRVVDGVGNARESIVESVGPKSAVLSLGSALPDLESEHILTLIVGALRPQRASWLVEKATEMGARSLRFVNSTRSPRSYGAGTVRRWSRVARSAVEQCGRARVPEISGPHDWSEMDALLEGHDRILLLHPADRPSAPTEIGASGRTVLVVGPEGGWTEEETELLARTGARTVSLGPRVLRVETAAIAALAWLIASAAGSVDTLSGDG